MRLVREKSKLICEVVLIHKGCKSQSKKRLVATVMENGLQSKKALQEVAAKCIFTELSETKIEFHQPTTSTMQCIPSQKRNKGHFKIFEHKIAICLSISSELREPVKDFLGSFSQ